MLDIYNEVIAKYCLFDFLLHIAKVLIHIRV